MVLHLRSHAWPALLKKDCPLTAGPVADMHACDVMQYVKWANKTDLDDFWTDPKVKRLFKNHIYAMTSRTNVYNGERLRAMLIIS